MERTFHYTLITGEVGVFKVKLIGFSQYAKRKVSITAVIETPEQLEGGEPNPMFLCKHDYTDDLKKIVIVNSGYWASEDFENLVLKRWTKIDIDFIIL